MNKQESKGGQLHYMNYRSLKIFAILFLAIFLLSFSYAFCQQDTNNGPPPPPQITEPVDGNAGQAAISTGQADISAENADDKTEQVESIESKVPAAGKAGKTNNDKAQ